ncbi:sigma-70 family RNA polymerase sigma factor [Mycetocola manganoxydans]|uniref:RNA polymerase sigma factor n=1 Tax=Mycetocola manganoxydans TaxID=699879 RepID=A0A3L6ZWB6_9MICO|nr:sigma-70 family RNA polymerase sigma factor [Mycetocola manganoxydans]GHD47927.1 RNA polymerase sigma factor SigK [Mycetocola manganoxydans]
MLVLVENAPGTESNVVAPGDLDSLLGQIAAGSQQAFASLYDTVAPRVLGLIRRVLVDHAQSEEVAQEVFLEIWQNATRFESGRGAASSWIMTIAHRRAIDRVRASQAGRDRDVKIGIRDFPDAFDQVAESAEISIEHERVSRAMTALTEIQRQAVSLAYYGGYSQSEVAEILSVPLGTVKTRLRDGMMKLRDEMGVAS